MVKVNILVCKEDWENMGLQGDDRFEVGIAYIDLHCVQSINCGEDDKWFDSKIFYLYLESTSYTILGDIDKFAEKIMKFKSSYIIGVN